MSAILFLIFLTVLKMKRICVWEISPHPGWGFLANQRTADRKSTFRIRLFEDHVIKILPFLFTTGASLKTDKNQSLILK